MDETKPLAIIFRSDELKKMGLPYNAPEGGKIISDNQYDSSRWSEQRELIVQFPDQIDTDKAWRFTYSHGLTEYQDEGPWEFEEKVTGTLVCKQQKTVWVWE